MKIINPCLEFNGNFSKRSSTKYIVLHHAEAFRASVFNVHSWHLQNGWVGIGYHYYVTKDGIIYAGRPETVVGSHCKGSNCCSIGICCEGNFDDSNPGIRCDKSMAPAQYEALVKLIEDIKSRNPRAEVKGHLDLYPTACPGKFYPLQELKYIFNKETYDVRKLQQLLKRFKHYTGEVDGIYGPMTEKAVKDFESKNGLDTTGKAEGKTLEKLRYFGL